MCSLTGTVLRPTGDEISTNCDDVSIDVTVKLSALRRCGSRSELTLTFVLVGIFVPSDEPQLMAGSLVKEIA